MTDAKAVCARSMEIMADGTPDDFAEVIHPDAYNRESVDEPPATRGRGPAAFHATALWLRATFSDMRWEVHEAAQDGDLVALHTTMYGRQTGTFVQYDEHARPAKAFAPTGRRFAVRHTHWFRVADGMVIEHWANRDDMSMALALGWLPPSPPHLLRSLLALRRAKRQAS